MSHGTLEPDLSAFGAGMDHVRSMWAADEATTHLGIRVIHIGLTPAPGPTDADTGPTDPHAAQGISTTGHRRTTPAASRPLGHATASMQVDARMVNGHGICHGGYIFALADSTFALACNASGHPTVAAGCDIDYLEPVRRGDVLIAEAHECLARGRTGITDVTVTRESDGRVVAVFRGRSRRLR